MRTCLYAFLQLIRTIVFDIYRSCARAYIRACTYTYVRAKFKLSRHHVHARMYIDHEFNYMWLHIYARALIAIECERSSASASTQGLDLDLTGTWSAASSNDYAHLRWIDIRTCACLSMASTRRLAHLRHGHCWPCRRRHTPAETGQRDGRGIPVCGRGGGGDAWPR